MYKTPDEARAFVREFTSLVAGHQRAEVFVPSLRQ